MDDAPQSVGCGLVALMKELREMPERQIVDQLELLQTSTYVFRVNHAELAQFLEYCERDPRNKDLCSMATIDKQTWVARETVRLLHNFVAAAMSLVDHTRVMYRHFHNDGDFPEYQREVDRRFARNGQVQFVQRLRSYLLHVRAPTISLNTTFDAKTGQPTTRLGLPSQPLLGWDGWNALAKGYLKNAGAMLDIAAEAASYERQVRDFYVWFGEKENDLLQPALERFRAKEAQCFLLAIDDRLESYFGDSGELGFAGDRFLFLGLFDVAEFEALERVAGPSAERTELALAKLSDRFTVPPDIEVKIRRALSEPRFFKQH
jgi:hypothetical protein